MNVRIKIVCENCGTDKVLRDATAVWSVEEQRWELCGVQDAAWCENEDCDRFGYPIGFEEVPA